MKKKEKELASYLAKLILFRKGMDDLQQPYLQPVMPIHTFCQSSHNLVTSLDQYYQHLLDRPYFEAIQKDFLRSSYTFQRISCMINPVNQLQFLPRCHICLTRNIDTFLVPCGHTGCRMCLTNIMEDDPSRCYMCRVPVYRLSKIFIT